MITIFANNQTVKLPWSLSWSYSNPRKQATRQALAGNDIQQYAAKNTSAGSFTYSEDIDSADAEILDSAQYATGEACVSDGSSAWVVVFDVQLKPSANPRKTNVTISMKCVRRIA